MPERLTQYGALQDGRAAAFAHEYREANPYEPGPYHDAWNLGYDLEATALSQRVEVDVD